MKLRYAFAAALIAFASPAASAQTNTTDKTTPAAAKTAAKPSTSPMANKEAWTMEQLKTLCHSRASRDTNNAKRYEICMERNKNKIGREKNISEANELKAAEEALERKAAAPK